MVKKINIKVYLNKRKQSVIKTMRRLVEAKILKSKNCIIKS